MQERGRLPGAASAHEFAGFRAFDHVDRSDSLPAAMSNLQREARHPGLRGFLPRVSAWHGTGAEGVSREEVDMTLDASKQGRTPREPDEPAEEQKLPPRDPTAGRGIDEPNPKRKNRLDDE